MSLGLKGLIRNKTLFEQHIVQNLKIWINFKNSLESNPRSIILNNKLDRIEVKVFAVVKQLLKAVAKKVQKRKKIENSMIYIIFTSLQT